MAASTSDESAEGDPAGHRLVVGVDNGTPETPVTDGPRTTPRGRSGVIMRSTRAARLQS